MTPRICTTHLDSRGIKTDDISGLYYAQARYYAAEVGRFSAEDPIKSGLNWYGYCNENPVMYIDPLGLKCSEIEFGIFPSIILILVGYLLITLSLHSIKDIKEQHGIINFV